MYVKEIPCKGLDCIHVGLAKVRWQAVVKTRLKMRRGICRLRKELSTCKWRLWYVGTYRKGTWQSQRYKPISTVEDSIGLSATHVAYQ